MSGFKEGEIVLVQARIVRRCGDERMEDKRGYVIRTSRGEVMIEPSEIVFPLDKTKLIR